LEIDIDILLNKKAYCCITNAATNRGANIEGVDNFYKLFEGFRYKIPNNFTSYEQAEVLIKDGIEPEYITKIIKKSDCDKVMMVPGNHDKKWDVYSKTRQMMRDTLLHVKNTKQLLEAKVKEPMSIGVLYTPFKQYYKLAAEYLSVCDVARKASVFPESNQQIEKMPVFERVDELFWTQQIEDMSGYKVFVHGSNSSLLSDKDDGESRNMIEGDGKHLQVLPLQAYNVNAKSNEIHIMMLHHPMSEIVNGNNIAKEFDARFKLQLYGHVHKQSSSSDDTIKIYSGAFMPEVDDNAEYFPIYNIIEMDVIEDGENPTLKVEVFCRKWDGTKFDEYLAETKTKERALKIRLQQNNSWKQTMERIKKKTGLHIDMPIAPQISPFAVKNAFLHSGREGVVIKEMYGDKFKGVSPNRIKYLTFLKQVDEDGRLEELNNILNRYDKR
jgi:predicted phosphohydrolase